MSIIKIMNEFISEPSRKEWKVTLLNEKVLRGEITGCIWDSTGKPIIYAMNIAQTVEVAPPPESPPDWKYHTIEKIEIEIPWSSIAFAERLTNGKA